MLPIGGICVAQTSARRHSQFNLPNTSRKNLKRLLQEKKLKTEYGSDSEQTVCHPKFTDTVEKIKFAQVLHGYGRG